MPVTHRRSRSRRIRKNQKGGGDFDSFCPFCHFPLAVPNGAIMHSFEDADQIERTLNKASWMDHNVVVDFERKDIFLLGPVSYGTGTATRPRIGNDGEGVVNNSGNPIFEEVEYTILNNFPDADDTNPKGYGIHVDCFREVAKLLEAAGYSVETGFFGSFYPAEFEECLESLGNKQLFGDGDDAPIDIENEEHYNPPAENPVFKQIFYSCPTIDYIAKTEKARRSRVVEAKRTERALAPLGLPPNVMSRMGGMFLKQGNLSRAEEAAVGGGGVVASGGAGKERRRRKTRRRARHH